MYSRSSLPPRAADEAGYHRAAPVRVPPNYSGSAFSPDPPDPPSEVRPDRSVRPSDVPQPDFRDLPQISTLPRRDAAPEAGLPTPVVSGRGEESVPPVCLPSAESCPRPQPQAAPLPSPVRPQPSHGWGQEEIVILGLCLLLLHEDGEEHAVRGDDSDLWETLILLGALLFF
ncbi:MAG: hypothetical protein MJ192_05005 [Clostridia bacterium]|nr:hypothetical protein [Clostridia bacterium]